MKHVQFDNSFDTTTNNNNNVYNNKNILVENFLYYYNTFVWWRCQRINDGRETRLSLICELDYAINSICEKSENLGMFEKMVDDYFTLINNGENVWKL